MLRKQRLLAPALVVAAALACNAALGAGEETPEKLFHEINSTTGKTAVDGQIRELSKSADAKKVIHYAHALAKKDRKALTYNGALILAEVARVKKAVAASEAFYHICTKEAVELESTPRLLEAFGGLIELLYDNRKYKECEKVCRQVLELQTGPAKPRVVLVQFSFAPGQDTFIPLDKFNAAKPLRGAVQRLMVQSVAKQGKYDEALQLVQKLPAQKTNWLTRDLQGWVLREAGKFEEAAKIYEAVLNAVANDKNIDAEDRSKYEDRYRYILSNLYVETKQLPKAIDELRALVKGHPDEPGYLNDLGFIMADHDMNLAESEQLIRKAIDLDRKKRKDDPEADDRDNGAYLDSLGWVLYKQKKYKEAKQWLLKAVKDESSQHIEIYDHLGDVLIALGERDAAVKSWQRGIEVAGDSRRDQELKTRVEEKIKANSK